MDRIEVKKGRLVYADGQEVSLWGTGYYVAHYAIYARCRELGLDPKQETFRRLAPDPRCVCARLFANRCREGLLIRRDDERCNIRERKLICIG